MNKAEIKSVLPYLKPTAIMAVLGIVYYPTLVWLWGRWNAADSYYSHGPLIILASLYFAWSKKERLKEIASVPWTPGIILLIAGILLHLAGIWSGIYFVSGVSILPLTAGLILYFFGTRIFRELLFPFCFLVFMLPLPLVFISDITFKMKMLATDWAIVLLNKVGIAALQEGSTIRTPNSFMVVEGQCSGLKYLISLTAFGFALGYSLQKTRLKILILFIGAVSFALLANILRIVLMGWVGDIFGMEAISGWFHDFSGFLMFFFAALLLILLNSLLED